MITNFEGLFRTLVDHEVEFVVIGGLAAVAHGSARATQDLGAIDLLGEVVGGGVYDDLANDAATVELFGMQIKVSSLKALITMKRAAGRPKDLEAIAELEKLREPIA